LHAYLCADGYVIRNPKTQKHNYYYVGLRNKFGLLKTEKREGLSPSDIFTPYGRYLLEGASVLRTYSLFLRKKKFIRGVLKQTSSMQMNCNIQNSKNC